MAASFAVRFLKLYFYTAERKWRSRERAVLDERGGMYYNNLRMIHQYFYDIFSYAGRMGLKSMAEKRKKLIDGFPGGVCFIAGDDSERIISANDELASFFHCSSTEEFLDLVHGVYRGMVNPSAYEPLSRVYGRLLAAGKKEYGFFRIPVHTENGLTGTLKAIICPKEDQNLGPLWALYIIDSTLQEETMRLDPLTGLMWRFPFYERIGDLLKKGELCLRENVAIYLNLTNFKVFNAAHGVKAGDELLARMASILRKRFPHALIAHMVADNFAIFALREGAEEAIRQSARDLKDYVSDPSITLKAGLVYGMRYPEGPVEPARIFDMAQTAADSIKRNGERTMASYDDSMGKLLDERAYVLNHFDEAIEKGYIKVFYQPVVRTLTGKLCSLEALARWVDPEKGMIYPNVFIPVLEESKLIHRLDCCIIEQAARHFHFLRENHLPLVPISFNLSQVDFDVIDPFSYVESVVKKYNLPRSLFHVEVTESSLTMSGARLKQEIELFRQVGYQCWLDDFGSGYSSLNVLQEFNFDELKLDMVFQRHFNENSKKIMRSIILMAKNLGIHTLAEGVETEEQLNYMKSLGCEKIQGYYFGKPMAYEECYEHCRKRNLLPEDDRERAVSENAGLINLITDTPVAVFRYDGKKVEFLNANEAFLKNTPGKDLTETSLLFSREALHNIIEKAAESRRTESLSFMAANQYMRCEVKIVGAVDHWYAGEMKVYNISMDRHVKETRKMDNLFRNLMTMYGGIYFFNRKENVVHVLSTRLGLFHAGETLFFNRWLKIEECIHPDDRERFLAFIRPGEMAKSAMKSRYRQAVGMFRFLEPDGSIIWKSIEAMLIGTDESGDFLICIKPVSLESIGDRDRVFPLMAESLGISPMEKGRKGSVSRSAILQALEQSEDILFFYKDKKRRFLGVSRAFLSCYGIKREDIIGKTDNEMGWHVSDEPVDDMEKRVLEKGISSIRQPVKCIIRGKLHHLEASKFPLYKRNKIVGLMGYFVDLDAEREADDQNRRLGLIDEETGLLSGRGLFMTGLSYYDHYKQTGDDFLAISVHIPEYNGLARVYGKEVGKKLTGKISAILTAAWPGRGILAYLGGGRFTLFVKKGDEKEAACRMTEAGRRIEAIHSIDGCSMTLYFHYALAKGSEAETLDGLLRLLTDRLEEKERKTYGETVYEGDRIPIAREAFDDFEDSVKIIDMDTYEILYMNRRALAAAGLSKDSDYRGKKCYKTLFGHESPCSFCPYTRLKDKNFYTASFHNPRDGKNYRCHHVLVPWKGRNGHLEIEVDCGKDRDM